MLSTHALCPQITGSHLHHDGGGRHVGPVQAVGAATLLLVRFDGAAGALDGPQPAQFLHDPCLGGGGQPEERHMRPV